MDFLTIGPVPTVISSPAGSPASGFTNTFDYPMSSSVTLTCMVDPMPSSIATVNYRWSATECYTKGGNRRCFPDSQMTQNVNDNALTLEDAGTITCTVTINGRSYASQPFTLRISGDLIHAIPNLHFMSNKL